MNAHAASTQTAIYLVGIARPGTLDTFNVRGSEPGLEPGQSTRVVSLKGFDALVIDVPADTFLADDADDRLQDIAWLTPRAERHEAIIRDARAHANLLPVGFGSVFSTEDALARTIAKRSPEIDDFLTHTQGCDEWSLKAWVSRKDAIERAKEALAAADASTAGAAYLRARRLENEAEQLAEDHALGLVEQLIEDLGTTIADACERRATKTDDDHDRWLIAHVALLIHRDHRAAFDARLDLLAPALEAEGLELELSGPWSPYSFCPEAATDEQPSGAS